MRNIKKSFEQGKIAPHALSRTANEATNYYRLLSNKRVTIEKIIEKECSICSDNLEEDHLLVLGDSSSINLDSHKGRIQDIWKMGVLEDNKSKGLLTHVNLAVDAKTNRVLGLTDVILWHRELADKGKTSQKRKVERTHQNYEEKEGYKWLLGAQNSHQRLSQKGCKQITYVFDREADSFEVIAGITEQSLGDLVVRCTHDRILWVNKKKQKLSEALLKSSIAGEYELSIPKLNHYSKTKGHQVTRKARKARIEVRILAVEMPVSSHMKQGKNRSSIPLYVIEAKEQQQSVPKGEKPIVWRLYTTHKTTTFEEALTIIGYYKSRWVIEQLFRILKTEGLDIESTELEGVEAIQKQIVIALGVATKMLQMVYVKDEIEEQHIKEVFKDEEIELLKMLNKEYQGKTKKQKNPHSSQHLSWAAWIIARLGGWKGMQSQRPPGPKTFYNGIIKFNSYLDAIKLFKADTSSQNET